MDRRAFLVGLAACAGCSGLESQSTETLTPAPVQTPEPRDTPGSSGQRFADIGCPSFLSSSLRRLCSHRLPPDPILALEPRPVVVGVDGENELVDSVWLTLRSNVTQEVTVFDASWAVYRYDDGHWASVASGSSDGGGTTVGSRGRHYWVLHSGRRDRSGVGVTDGRVTLSPGRYAFAVVAITGTSRTTVECIALFEVVRDGSP